MANLSFRLFGAKNSSGNDAGNIVGEISAIGTGGAASNRRLDLATTYASATNSCTFTEGQNVREVFITFWPDVNAASLTDTIVFQETRLCFDATSDAVAGSWLATGASGTLDYPSLSIPVGVRVGPFSFPSYLSRIDSLPEILGDLVVEAS